MKINVRRQILRIGLVVTLILIIMGCFCSTQAETIQKTKLVHVVLDDSGSMENAGRWEKAQYAMQILAGLLNPGDELKVYYLNSPSWESDLSAKGIQNTMKKIAQTDYTEYITNFAEVEKAYKSIQTKCKKKQYDQCWLVVISDGAFNGNQFQKKNFNPDSVTEERAALLRKTFKEYVEKPFENGKRLQLIYCRIGTLDEKDADPPLIIEQSENDLTELNKEGIFCYAAGENGIIPVMEEIANRISGRSRIENNKITQLNNQTLKAKLDIPLFNFVVLVQGTDAKLTSVTQAASNNLTISRSALVKTGKRWKKFNIPSGSVYTVENGNGNISAGEYSLVFNNAISMDKVVIFAEPALEIRLSHYKNGKVITQKPEDTVSVGQQYGALARIYEYGQKAEFDEDKLPKGFVLTTEIENGKDNFNATTGTQTATINKVSNNKVSVWGRLKLPGYSDISAHEEFVPIVGIPDTVVVTTEHISEKEVLTVTIESLKAKDPDNYIDFVFTDSDQSLEDIKGYVSDGTVIIHTDIHYRLEYPKKEIIRFIPEYSDSVQLDQPYNVVLSDKTGKQLKKAAVVVVASEFCVVPDKKTINEKITGLQEGNHLVRFELLVDDETVNAENYQDRLDVIATGYDQSIIKPEWKIVNGKIEIPVEKWNDIRAQKYGLAVYLDQTKLLDEVILDIRPTNYEVQCVGGDGLIIGALDLQKNDKSLVFRVVDKAATPEEILSYDELEGNIKIQADSSRIATDYYIDRNTGNIVITPTNHDNSFLYYFTRAFDPQGERTISIQYCPENKWGEGKITLQPKSIFDIIWPYAVTLITIFLVTLIIYLWIKKPKFKRGTSIYYITCMINDGSIVNDENGNDWDYQMLKPCSVFQRLWLLGAEWTMVNGYKVRACKKSPTAGKNTVEICLGEGTEWYNVRTKFNTDKKEIDIPIHEMKTAIKEEWKTLSTGTSVVLKNYGSSVTLFVYKK